MNKVSPKNRKIYIRFAETDDSEDVYNWRNDEKTRQASFHTEEIKTRDHQRWFKDSLQNPDRNIFIIIDEQCQKLGEIRFDRKKKSAEISIIINPKYRNQGLGSECLTKIVRHYFHNFYVKRLVAKVKNNNIASLKAFEKAGFKIYKKFEEYIELRIEINKELMHL